MKRDFPSTPVTWQMLKEKLKLLLTVAGKENAIVHDSLMLLSETQFDVGYIFRFWRFELTLAIYRFGSRYGLKSTRRYGEVRSSDFNEIELWPGLLAQQLDVARDQFHFDLLE